MTDKELLELAAKAAGITGFWVDAGLNTGSNATPAVWNPLTDDGDALRLAVQLRIELMFEKTHKVVTFACVGKKDVFFNIDCDNGREDQIYEKARRAIVLAAAEIGGSK